MISSFQSSMMLAALSITDARVAGWLLAQDTWARFGSEVGLIEIGSISHRQCQNLLTGVGIKIRKRFSLFSVTPASVDILSSEVLIFRTCLFRIVVTLRPKRMVSRSLVLLPFHL
jgi:hypothetical protein